MKVAIGADHRGFVYKQMFLEKHSEWEDVGAFNDERSDFPVFAQKVVSSIESGQTQEGILLCGTGTGMAITANRFKKIYAAVVWNTEVAQLAKEHNNANILVIPVDFVSFEQSEEMIAAWRNASFLEGRYAQRIALFD